MEDKIEFENKGKYLFIKGEGERSELSEMFEGAVNLAKLAKQFKTNYILVDYTKMRYKVNFSEAFNVVRMYEDNMPLFKDVTASIATNDNDLELGKFWESVSSKRNFNFKVFNNLSSAEEWLLHKIKM